MVESTLEKAETFYWWLVPLNSSCYALASESHRYLFCRTDASFLHTWTFVAWTFQKVFDFWYISASWELRLGISLGCHTSWWATTKWDDIPTLICIQTPRWAVITIMKYSKACFIWYTADERSVSARSSAVVKHLLLYSNISRQSKRQVCSF